jgi:hypothetical protein
VFGGLLTPPTLAMAFLERGHKKGYILISELLKLAKFRANDAPFATPVPSCLMTNGPILERIIEFRAAAPWSMNGTFLPATHLILHYQGCPNVVATGEISISHGQCGKNLQV